MPAATTHNEFAKDLYHNLPEEIRKQVTDIRMFNLGNQGPDFLFHDYIGLTPDSYKKYGDMLHTHKVIEFIDALYKYCKNDYALLSYFYGYLGHYSLDSVIHPLVYYNQKILMKDVEATETEKHFKIEAVMDVHALNRHQLTVDDFCVHKDIRISRENRRKLGEVYHRAFREVFDLDLKARKIGNACRLMSIFMGLLKPNSELKFIFYGLIEEQIFHQPFVTSLSLHNKLDFDVINQAKRTTFNFWHQEMTSDQSFDEMYDQALKECIERLSDITNREFYIYNFEGQRIIKEENQ